MRIAMLLDTDFPPDSRVENEATSLIQAGHQLFLFSLSYKVKHFEKTVINGIEVHRFPAGKLTYKLSALAYTFPFFHWIVSRSIKKFISSVSPDVLHIHDMPLARAVFMVNKVFQKPTILDLHEDRPEIMPFYGHMTRGYGRYLINIDNWRIAQVALMKQADRLILVTEEAKAKYVQLGVVDENKVTVVPNTIRPDIFLDYKDDEQILERFDGMINILYLGDTGVRRGTDTAIQAMTEILSRFPETRLILVGSNKEDEILKDMVASQGLSQQVLFEGWQDVSKFPSYVKASTICISPLKRNPHHDTTYANKLFQYMAMGKPVLVSNCPAQQKVVEDTACGLIHVADDPKSYAEQVLQLLQHPELCLEMGNNGLNAIKTSWNWDITGAALLDLYENLRVD